MELRTKRLFSFSLAVMLLGALSACGSTGDRELSYTYKEILTFGDVADADGSLVDNWSNKTTAKVARAPASQPAPAAPVTSPRKAATLTLKTSCAVHAATDDQSKVYSRLKAKTKLWITPSGQTQWGKVNRKSGPAYMRYDCFN